jgi:hypothetical protein
MGNHPHIPFLQPSTDSKIFADTRTIEHNIILCHGIDHYFDNVFGIFLEAQELEDLGQRGLV